MMRVTESTPKRLVPRTNPNQPTAIRKIILTLVLILAISATAIPVFANRAQSQAAQPAQLAANAFQTGWWEHQSSGTGLITTYQSQGQTFFLLDGGYCGIGQLASFKTFLDAANQAGMKVIVKLTCKDNSPSGISTTDFVNTINALKSYPALFAWGLGDEPELSSDAAVRTRRHDIILTYYNLVKQNDTHPVFISHDFNSTCCGHDWVTPYLDVEDLVGMHAYPYYAQNAEYIGSGNIYDKWTNVVQLVANYNAAHGTNKQFLSATMQGFGNGVSPWRNPTLGELRYETFTAVVQGVKNIMFWMDQWADTAGMKPMVAQVMAEEQSIGRQMNAGKTSDPAVGVSVTDRTKLAYRYGTDGTTGAILAVNIANRTGSGSTLSSVKFTLPAGVHPSQITVVAENRTLTVAADNSFTDTFNPFAVHIYTFSVGTNSPPPATPTATRAALTPTATRPPATATPLPSATATRPALPTATQVVFRTPTATAAPQGTVAPTATATFQALPDTTAPDIKLTSPLNNAQIRRKKLVTISASATDNIKVTKVEFLVNNSLLCTVTAAPYTCNWSAPNTWDKAYTINVKAYDPAQNSSSASVVVNTIK